MLRVELRLGEMLVQILHDTQIEGLAQHFTLASLVTHRGEDEGSD